MQSSSPSSPPSQPPKRQKRPLLLRLLFGFFICIFGLVISAVLVLGYALVVAQPNLPSLDALTDYRPKVPLRIYTADHVLIGEFGEERRSVVRIQDVPDHLKKAVLAIEDARFYDHGGVDLTGILRAGTVALTNGHASQGASTITMQVARNFFLSSEKTYTRKIYEMLLAYKIERALTKDQILEVYMNQIYLGQRAYGFASAARVYFGKDLKDISLAEAAMLAGLPKAPSAYNPVVNPKRAKVRQEYILQRMLELHYITQDEYDQASKQPLVVKGAGREFSVHAEYVAEMVRQMMYAQYREEAYTRGLNVVTTIDSADQDAAYRAVRKGLMDYEHRHGYRGPEGFIDLPANADDREQAIDDALVEHPDNGEIVAAVVTSASPKEVKASFIDGNVVTIDGNNLRFVASALSDRAQPNQRIRPGAIVRLVKDDDGAWTITQLPQVEGALVSVVPQDGAIRALVGGFDFNKNKFNHVTQAWRQPGSSFKPFVYSASLEKGLSPATIINDAPLFFSAAETGGQAWEPKNYGGGFDGPMTMRQALMKSTQPRVDPDPEPYRHEVHAGLHHEVRLRRRPPSGLSADGARRRSRHAAADGDRVFGIRERRVSRESVSDRRYHRSARRGGVASAAARRAGNRAARDHAAQCLRDEQPSAKRRAARHGVEDESVEARRSRRQDGHDERLTRRVVRGLPAFARGDRVDRLRQSAQPRRQGNGRRARLAGVDGLHGARAARRAGMASAAATRRDLARQRAVLRRHDAGTRLRGDDRRQSGAAAGRRRVGRDGAGARCRRAGKAGHHEPLQGTVTAPFRRGHEPGPVRLKS